MEKLLKYISYTIGTFILGTIFAVSAYAMTDSNSLTIHRYTSDLIPIEGIEYTIHQVDISSNTEVTIENAEDFIITGTTQVRATDSNGLVTFLNLVNGCYYVVETKSIGKTEGSSEKQYYTPVTSFMVTLPLEDDEDGLLQDVHIYPKSEVFIDKFINRAGSSDPDFSDMKKSKHMSVYTEQRFGWTIEALLPSDIGAAGNEYVVTDSLPDKVSFDEDSINVYTVPSHETKTVHAYKLIPGEHYTIGKAENSFCVTLTDKGRTHIQSRLDASVDETYLRIKYDSRLECNCKQHISLYAGATVRYSFSVSQSSNRAGAPMLLSQMDTAAFTSTVNYEPEVHTGQIKINKYELNTTTPLADAEFAIAKTKADAEAGNYFQTGKTDSDGELFFKGLAYGKPGDLYNENTGDTTYWIVEVKAPEGYFKISEPIEVTFNYYQDPDGKESYFAEIDAYNKSEKTSGNNPKTGDTSHSIYIVRMLVGLTLFMIAINPIRHGKLPKGRDLTGNRICYEYNTLK